MKSIRLTAAALALATVSAAPLAATAAESSDHRTFDGTVVHVSTLNLKVKGVEGGKQQTLSFVYVPRFGKASPIYKVHAGEYVRVTYDQKGAGARHVDKITPQVMGKGMKM
ncbi:MAG: hypothetical protein NVS3B16_20830 [Vulcanimicrobiaceae bacterium]